MLVTKPPESGTNISKLLRTDFVSDMSYQHQYGQIDKQFKSEPFHHFLSADCLQRIKNMFRKSCLFTNPTLKINSKSDFLQDIKTRFIENNFNCQYSLAE